MTPSRHAAHIDARRFSRREVLLAAAATAVAAGMPGCASNPATNTGAALPVPLTEGSVRRVVGPKALPFDLSAVRLSDGPFKEAQARDATYLLSLEPDRMLHNFRVNAGLDPKAPVYGGWESVATWADIRAHGHTLGHYLSACSMMYASTGDDRFKARCDAIVAELQACQVAGKTGLVCAFPDYTRQFENAVAGRRFVGVPWYTTHKILAGLRDTYLYCHSAAALDVLVKVSDWTEATTANMTAAEFQHMLDTEHGGMNEVLADVYVFTGDRKYLELARRFCHHAVLDPLAHERDTLDRLHSNTQIPKFIGFERLHQLTGDADYHAASAFFWKTVVERRSFVTGGNADNEHFFPIADFPQHLGSAKTMETCCTYNMLRLTRMLFEDEPSAQYADYYERALYNGILASQDPESGMVTYFQPLRPGYVKLFGTPIDSFWCCTGTGMENHAKYADSIYFHGDRDLYVNLFIPSALDWKARGLKVTQTTRYPDEPRTTLTIGAVRPIDLTFRIRHPAWCGEATVTVNGKVAATSKDGGSYVAVTRRWRNGDTIEIELPMTIRTVPLPASNDTVAVVYGPIVLAGQLGKQGLTPGADIIVNERTYGDMLNEKIDVPALAGDRSSLAAAIAPVSGSPLTFTAPIPGNAAGLTLKPYFRTAHERYSVYWKLADAPL